MIAVCGVVRSWNPADDPEKKHIEVENVIPIAGNFDSSTGSSLDPKVSRLKAQDSSADGLQIELNGGNYNHMRQKAVIQLQCDKERTGNEERRRKAKRDGDEAGDDDDKKDGDDKEEEPPSTSSLQFVSYGPVEGKEKLEVLRLNWKTKYACEDYADSDEAVKKSGWGFFTWFVLLYVCSCTFVPSSTNFIIQRVSRHRRLSHLRLMAQLQPLRCSRVGLTSPRRHDPRHPLFV